MHPHVISCDVVFPSVGGQILKTKVLIENVHYILLPEVVWKILVTWYGNTGYAPLALPRMVYTTFCSVCYHLIVTCFLDS